MNKAKKRSKPASDGGLFAFTELRFETLQLFLKS